MTKSCNNSLQGSGVLPEALRDSIFFHLFARETPMEQPLYQRAPSIGFGGAGSQLDQDNDFVNLGVFLPEHWGGRDYSGTAPQAGALQIRHEKEIYLQWA